MISEQLTSRYGLAEELRDVLLAAPVALRVSSLATGRFKASVQARLMVPAKHLPKLEDSLDAVATALVRRGFQREQHALQMLKEPSSNRVAEVWLDSNGDLSGGWSLGPETQGQVELLLALGEAPTLGPHPLKRLGQQRLRLRGRPDELVQLGWLGRGWPRVIRNASQLELEMTACRSSNSLDGFAFSWNCAEPAQPYGSRGDSYPGLCWGRCQGDLDHADQMRNG